MDNAYRVTMEGVRRTEEPTIVFTEKKDQAPLEAFLRAAMATGWAFCPLGRLPDDMRPVEMSRKDMPPFPSARPVAFVSRFNAHDIKRRFGEWLGGEPMAAYNRIEVRKGIEKAYFEDLETYDPPPFALSRLLHAGAFDGLGYRKDGFAPRSLPGMRPFDARRVGEPTLFLFPAEDGDAIRQIMHETGKGGWAVMDMDALRGHFRIDGPDAGSVGLVSYYDRDDVAGYHDEWMNGPAYREYAERADAERKAALRMAGLWEKDPAPLA